MQIVMFSVFSSTPNDNLVYALNPNFYDPSQALPLLIRTDVDPPLFYIGQTFELGHE
jgi:hypothetical protein